RRPWPGRSPGRVPTRRGPWARRPSRPSSFDRSRFHLPLRGDADGGRCSFEALRLPRRSEGDVDLIGAGFDVAADFVSRLFFGTRERGRAEELGQVPELGVEILGLPRQGHVDRTADLRRIAAYRLAVAEEDLTLA